ncbi:MAG: 7TM diverse intracellular signaling domain-containing protein [Myxococcota bacterium]|nr:7TM diverse intracellular signaling domain-containing protein [Myxococcota bacterium]
MSTPQSRARGLDARALRAPLAAGLATFGALAGLGGLLHANREALAPPMVERGDGLDLALIGGLLVLAAYNGLSYVPTRQVSYLLYAALGAALTTVYATYFDASAAALGLVEPARTTLNHVASGCGLTLALAFALAFLRVHERKPRLAGILTGVGVALGVLSLTAVPLLDPRAAEIVNAVIGALVAPAVIGLGVDALRGGFRAARFYLAAWVPLVALVVLSALEVLLDRQLGGGGRALLLANVLEMLLLALALTDRVKLAIEDRERAHRSEVRALEDELEAVKNLGPYTLLDKIGEGGMGVVYEAKHALLRRPTAVKLIHPRWAGEEALERFEREVQATSRLTHPNTVTVFDYGRTDDGILYYAMELLDGATLAEVVEVGGPLDPGRVAQIVAMVSGALDEAHRAGLIHRDIKPGNVLLCRQGGAHDVAKVVDFGLVKELHPDAARPDLSGTSNLSGTPLYMAPEQLTEQPTPEPRSDLYALGAVAYYLLTGRQLFEGGTVFQIMLRHMREDPPRPSTSREVPADLEALVLSLLAKDPADRPRDAAEARRRAEACACHADWTPARAEAWWKEHEDALAALRRTRAAQAQSQRSPLGVTVAARRRRSA